MTQDGRVQSVAQVGDMTTPGDVALERVSTPEQLAELLALRMDVFVREQLVPEAEEIDDLDFSPSTVHVLARDLRDGQVVATARLLTDSEDPGVVHIGRVAVAAHCRGSGLGRAVMDLAEAIALEEFSVMGHVIVELSAQVQALGFYANCGYVARGRVYMDAGIEHRDAIKTLAAAGR